MACLSITVNVVQQSELAVNVVQKASLAVGEICRAGSGTLVVLAGRDGPLRTRDGGFILLDPAREPPS